MLTIEMGVDLGGPDGGVTEHLLDGTQVSPPLDHVAGEGVPERVGPDSRGETRGLCGGLDPAPCIRPVERAAGPGEEDLSTALVPR